MYKLPSPEPMSELRILEKAHQFWLEYVREVGPEHVLNCGVDFDKVYDAVIYPKHEITLDKEQDLGLDDFGDPILGKFISKDKTALIDKKLFESRDPRRVFTEWHECTGHGVLQGEFLRKTASKNQKLYSTEKSMFLIENAFEWQANTFAANVAAPRNYVRCIFIKLFGMRRKIRYCGPRRYSLCYNNNTWFVYVRSPFELAWRIAKRMQHYFWGLSAESLAYQLLEVAIDNNGYDNGGFGRCEFAPVLGDLTASYIKNV